MIQTTSYAADLLALLRLDDETGERMHKDIARTKPFSQRQLTEVHNLLTLAYTEPLDEAEPSIAFSAVMTLGLRLAKTALAERAMVARIKQVIKDGIDLPNKY